MGKAIKQATGADVRSWARETGVEVGARGRFSAEVQKAFNDANKGQMRYTPGNTETVTLRVRVQSSTGKQRVEPKQFTLREVRTAAGPLAKSRGRLSSKALEAAAEALSVAKSGAQATAEPTE